MELFTVLDDSLAIIRVGKGVEKQVKLYRRGVKLYVPHAGGYVEIRKKLENGEWYTTHPQVRLVEYTGVKTKDEAWLGQMLLRYVP
jgi:hypothetical protein